MVVIYMRAILRLLTSYYRHLFRSDFNDLPTDNLTDDVANVS